MRVPLAADGLPFVLVLLLISAVFLLASFYVFAALFLAFSILVAAFFRDPNRKVWAQEGALLSPADGKVVAVRQLEIQSDHQRPDTLVAIFMSLFDCHINRSPVAAKVGSVLHTKGKFLPAFKDEASRMNERNSIELVDEWGDTVRLTQVAGVLARRIVCRIRSGDQVDAGQRIGLIKFGSRVDVVIPASYCVSVRVGDKVRAGQDVLGQRLHKK